LFKDRRMAASYVECAGWKSSEHKQTQTTPVSADITLQVSITLAFLKSSSISWARIEMDGTGGFNSRCKYSLSTPHLEKSLEQRSGQWLALAIGYTLRSATLHLFGCARQPACRKIRCTTSKTEESSQIDEPDVTLMHYHASADILNAFGAVSTRRRCLILTRSLENNSMVVRLMLCNMKRLHELDRNAWFAKQGRHKVHSGTLRSLARQRKSGRSEASGLDSRSR